MQFFSLNTRIATQSGALALPPVRQVMWLFNTPAMIWLLGLTSDLSTREVRGVPLRVQGRRCFSHSLRCFRCFACGGTDRRSADLCASSCRCSCT